MNAPRCVCLRRWASGGSGAGRRCPPDPPYGLKIGPQAHGAFQIPSLPWRTPWLAKVRTARACSPLHTPSGQGRRPVGALMSRCRPGTRQRAARTRPQVRAGQRGPRLGSTARWADGAASRRGRCAPCPATGRVIRAQAFPNAPRMRTATNTRFVSWYVARRRPYQDTQAERRSRQLRGAFMYSYPPVNCRPGGCLIQYMI